MTVYTNRLLVEYFNLEVPGEIYVEVTDLVRSIERLILSGQPEKIPALVSALKQVPGYQEFSVSEATVWEYDIS